jgi:hypothetical protein
MRNGGCEQSLMRGRHVAGGNRVGREQLKRRAQIRRPPM